MNNHLAYHWLRKIAKALVAGVPCRILDNLVYSRMKLDERLARHKILGVRLTKRLSKYLEIQMRQTHHITSDLSSWSSRKVHQANERVLRTRNKITQKTSSFYFTYYIIITIWKHNISSRDKVFHNYSYFFAEVDKIIKSFNRSQNSSSSTTWVYARLQAPEHRLGGYSHRERWLRTR
jgi:hypothetical protein